MSEFLVTIRPRYGEVDGMGVVYHAHYLVYFDVGRTEFMRAHGTSYAEVERGGHQLVVVDAAVQYLRPAHYDEQLSLAVRLDQVRSASVTFGYELRRGAGEVLATGHTRLGCLDDRRRPTRLPAAVREGLLGRPRPATASESR